MTSQQIVPMRDKITTIRALLEKSKPQIALALPSHLKVDRLLRVAMTSIQKNPKLLEATPTSLIGAVMECAQLGLEPDGLLGQAYLVPFRNKKGDGQWVTEVTLIPGYKGLYKLVRNSGELSTVTAEVVYRQDQFSVVKGLDPQLTHVPTEEAHGTDEEDIRAFYAVAKLRDGGVQFQVMWKWEVDAIRARSKSKDSGPWVTDYAEMGKKTVLRRLAKLLPASVEAQRAVALDERAEAGLSQELDGVIDIQAEGATTPEIAPPSRLDQIVGDAAKTAGPPPVVAQETPKPAPPAPTPTPLQSTPNQAAVSPENSPAMRQARSTLARRAQKQDIPAAPPAPPLTTAQPPPSGNPNYSEYEPPPDFDAMGFDITGRDPGQEG